MSNKRKQAKANDSKGMGILIGAVVAVIAVMVIVGVVLAVQLLSIDHTGEADMTAIQKEINSMKVADFTETDEVTEYVKLTVKGHGDIVIRLRADIAPLSAENFQNLVKTGHYNDTIFHRIMKGFMIQGGDPESGKGSMDAIKGEFSENGVRNELQHIKGVISMARTNQPNSATSQFFICNDDARDSLDGKYAAFGYVVAGLEVVDSISDIEVTYSARGELSAPVETVMIEKVCFVTRN